MSDIIQHERLSGQFTAAPVSSEPLKAGDIITFMVMPAGTHTCDFTQGNRGAKRTVAVTPESAAALQEQLAAANDRRKGKQRCFFDFDHKGDGPAAAWPLAFTWQAGERPGVYCRAELSAAGAEAIMGKTYRSFSPVFSVTKGQVPARVIPDPDPELCMGGLVNQPAFHDIEPLWAKQTQATNMKTINMEVYCAEAQADIAEALAGGDYPGHPFRGNQFADGEDESDSAERHSERSERLSERAKSKGDADSHHNAGRSHASAASRHSTAAEKFKTGGDKKSARYHQSMARAHNKQAAFHFKSYGDAGGTEDVAGADFAARRAVTENQTNTKKMSEKQQAVAASEATDAETLRASNAQLQQKLEQMEAADAARRKSDAEAAVAEAVRRGAIPAANEQLKAKWTKWGTDSPEMLDALKAMPGNESLAAREPGVQREQLQASPGPALKVKALAEKLAASAKLRGFDAQSNEARGRNAAEIAQFWASEMRGNREFLHMPLGAMAERLAGATLETAGIGTFSGAIITLATLDYFRLSYPMFRQIYTDFSNEVAQLSQTITTRIVSRCSVSEYDQTLGTDGRPNGWTTAQNAVVTDASTSLDKYWGVPIVFDAQMLSKTPRRLFDEQSPAAASALAEAFAAKVYALLTAANYNGYAAVDGDRVPVAYATYAKAVIDFARSAFVDLAAIFNPNKVPVMGRYLLLNSAYHAAAGKDPSLVTFWAGTRNPEMITDGELPRMSKFQPIECPDFPTSANRVGFAGQRSAVVAISRLPADYSKVLGSGAGNGSVMQLSDPETGLAINLVEYVNHQQGYAERRMETQVGAGVGDKRAGLVITSS